ncbi:hypothetical protein J3T65_03745 [Staphylococcus simiae]|uniref:hypothetical protein n=1 Tax=Staphylococcus simiae TaxID=308354 RepID=UPI001A96F645|nr:hypothetical protein [Staphylococcus simiae]MBO1198681.1 hypothetical protein [Staphylococcus simiae]MBO1200834.1 hypothetical protein [Staphylococcus simiae]MBO1203042.1 hypothetical protein [Staphylococcus simiae]MBO1211307.1 hypothetical protein [Staphylococcus simiae]MBO1229170.1 hypothetical protein [Staphylococcus simiae]
MKKLMAIVLAMFLLLAACGQNNEHEQGRNKDNDSKEKTTQQDQKSDDKKVKEKNNKANKTKDSNQANEQQSNSKNQQANNVNNSNQQPTTNHAQNGDPYQSENAVKIARNLYPFDGDEEQALATLPNFQNALNSAETEANKFGNNQKVYNDYSIDGSNGKYNYVFSFKDPNVDAYSIVTVNQEGQVAVIDPNYQQ